MREPGGKSVAIVIHGAFQSHENVGGAALVLKDLGVKEVHIPDLAGHGVEKDTEISGKNLIEGLAEDLLSRRKIKQSLNRERIERVTLIGHSLGASVALAVAKQLIVNAESVNLILVEPIFWLGKECGGQDDLLNNLETHIPQTKTQIEITNYLRALLKGDNHLSSDFSVLTNLANSNKAIVSLIRGGRSSVQSKEQFKIETSDGVITCSVIGQEIGSLVPDDYCNRDLFDNQLAIKQAGHNPFTHTSFYEWLRLLINQTESIDEANLQGD